MKRKSTNNLSSFISSLMILMLVGLVVGFLFLSTNNFTTGAKSFYLKCGSNTMFNDVENFNILMNKEYRFYVNTPDGTNNNFIVSVVPNKKADFKFLPNGYPANFSETKSLSKGFSIVTYEKYFTLTATMDLIDILNLYYSVQNLIEVPTAIDSGIPYFKLVITAPELGETININFNIKSEI